MKDETAIVTGASGGIGAAVVHSLVHRGYNVVGNSRAISKSALSSADRLSLVDGDIGDIETARKVTESAVSRFGSINHVVNCAGIYTSKLFTEYSADDLDRFLSTNLAGFVYLTQFAVKQMLKQNAGGTVTTITAALADNPMVGSPASIPMMTKGGLNSITLSLANEFARNHIRFNAVAPGAVDTSLHSDHSLEILKTLSPMGTVTEPQDVADAVVYLIEARFVTGEVLHVDGGAHAGRW